MLIKLGILLSFATVPFSSYRQIGDVQGVTFANATSEVYVPIRELATATNLPVEWNDAEQQIYLDGKFVDRKPMRKGWDNANLMPISALANWDAEIEYEKGSTQAKIKFADREVAVDIPPKYVQVSLKHQELRAWQGDRQVMVTNICSGGPGNRTPQGSFKAGPAKNRHHYSRLYNNSYMPFAVQINGNIFIHGYKSVPRVPSSHGCVRMPLTGKNAARYFFDWVNIGTPVDVVDDWTQLAKSMMPESETAGD